ncbi:MAG TPA: hypothetical protein VHY59_00535 [Chthoniobacterales bacterium]|nr:hypothetical protein [Chthoniobacterales bacterium]
MNRHLITASIIIVIGAVLLAMFLYTRHEALDIEANCQAKGLEVYRIGEDKVCREHSTGLLYAPP